VYKSGTVSVIMPDCGFTGCLTLPINVAPNETSELTA
jgi:hypothetical protein